MRPSGLIEQFNRAPLGDLVFVLNDCEQNQYRRSSNETLVLGR